MDTLRIEELDRAQCWEHLAQERVGRLAVSVDNRPDIFPVNYLLADDGLYVRTAPGFKLAAALLGRAVAFEVDGFDLDARTGWSVVVRGRAHDVEGVEEWLAADDLGIDPWAGGDKNRFIRIDTTEVSGRRIPPMVE